MEDRETYIKAGLKERFILNEIIKHNPELLIVYTTKVDSFDQYDAVLGDETNEYITEIKCRSIGYEIGIFPGYMIQKDKYDYLLSQHKKNGLIPIYINIFKEGYIWWNLLECTPPTFKLKLCQRR